MEPFAKVSQTENSDLTPEALHRVQLSWLRNVLPFTLYGTLCSIVHQDQREAVDKILSVCPWSLHKPSPGLGAVPKSNPPSGLPHPAQLLGVHRLWGFLSGLLAYVLFKELSPVAYKDMMRKFEAKIKMMQERKNRAASSETLLAFPWWCGKNREHWGALIIPGCPPAAQQCSCDRLRARLKANHDRFLTCQTLGPKRASGLDPGSETWVETPAARREQPLSLS